MHAKDLTLLQCPYCLSQFEQGTVWKKRGLQWEFASVFCHCDEFPIVRGVLYLHKPKHREILDFLRQKQFVSATVLALTDKPRFHPDRFIVRTFNRWVGEFLAADFLKRLGTKQVARLLSFVQPPQIVKYYFQREEWQDALAIVLPLAVLKTKKLPRTKQTVWFDVGSGMSNFFGLMQSALPNLKIISLDKNFDNLFLSNIFYPAKDVIHICGDARFLHAVRPHTLDVVTLIDVLQTLDAVVPVLEQLVKPGWIKKAGMFFVSGIPEHLYLPRAAGIFPIQRQIIEQFFAKSAALRPKPTFFDNERLCKSIVAGHVDTPSVTLKKKQSTFRYAFWWSPTQQLPEQMDTTFIPSNVRDRATLIWENATVTWSNKAY